MARTVISPRTLVYLRVCAYPRLCWDWLRARQYWRVHKLLPSIIQTQMAHMAELGVHEWIECMNDCLCPRAQPKGIKNVHALNPIHEPRSYISLWWTILHTPSFCRFIPLIFQKDTKNNHLYCHFPHLKVPVKSATCLECTIQNRGVCCARSIYGWAHNNKYLWRTSNFSA